MKLTVTNPNSTVSMKDRILASAHAAAAAGVEVTGRRYHPAGDAFPLKQEDILIWAAQIATTQLDEKAVALEAAIRKDEALLVLLQRL